MGALILFGCTSIALAFLSGMLFVTINDSPDEDFGCLPIMAVFGFIISVGLFIGAIYEYYQNKEYPLTKYELKKKVITIEENNTVKMDTVYTFKHK